jgi:hypothetical protein
MDPKIVNEYRSLLMMRECLAGELVKDIAARYGVTARTASQRIKAAATACMREAMRQTQGDPEHPATVRFTVEEFTADPREAMDAMMRTFINVIETRYPQIKEIAKQWATVDH